MGVSLYLPLVGKYRHLVIKIHPTRVYLIVLTNLNSEFFFLIILLIIIPHEQLLDETRKSARSYALFSTYLMAKSGIQV